MNHQLTAVTAILDIDPAVYACAFAGQYKRYIYTDAEGSVLVDYRIKKTASRGWTAVTTDLEGKDEVIATGYSRHELQNGMDLKYPYCIREEYLHVEPWDNVKKIVESMLKAMVRESQCEAFIGAMSKGQTFRHAFATIKEYKGNRKNTEKPVYYQKVRDYFQQNYSVVVVESYEADDYLACLCHANPKTAICASIDKDLDTVPGAHYKHLPDKSPEERWYTLTPFQAMRNFYTQMLTGDTADNIPGLSGIGPKRAEKILDGCRTIQELHDAVCEAYKNRYGDKHEYPHWKLTRIEELEGTEMDEDEAMELATLQAEQTEHPTGFWMTRSWREIMDENGVLLWMVRDTEEPYWTSEWMETIIPAMDEVSE